MDLGQTQFLTRAVQQAEQSGHIFPVMAACEAALESGWGKSGLAILANNLFGTKTPHDYDGPLVSIPTREFINGQWVQLQFDWVRYDSQQESFAARMDTLKRLATSYPHYDAALKADNYYTYIKEVSLTWSTDPDRASKVLSIYNEWTSQ